MDRGLYISATSLISNRRRMDAISNNLANGNTTGYKKDVVISESFPNVLLSKINDKSHTAPIKDFQGVEVNQEGDVYKVSLETGYFRVETPAGIDHSKELNFVVDESGYLKTYYRNENGNIKTDGENVVLGKNGPIRVEDGDIEIDREGNIMSNGQTIDNIVTFANPNVIGTMGNGVRLDRLRTNFTQGNFIETNNTLDLALKGQGFFKVQVEDETMYTRDGNFKLNNNGELVTSNGLNILGQDGPIVLGNNQFSIEENGDIIVDNAVIDTIDVVDVENKEYLRKQGDNLYKMLEDGNGQTINGEEVPFNGEVLSGYIEGSNVNNIKEMVKMISVLRNYEAGQKVIKAKDDMLGKAVSEIARV
ncbi:flagellar hook-basal body protein [Dethiothermospora halolimnae]|uniref:flagellar hook-basal body protein n=1 Tax=Dethiothermospora halolimnae TaxID=3114390 RepID=UPI003CCBFD57